MNKYEKQRRLRKKRFAKEQRRKEFHDFNVAAYHERQQLFDATFGKRRHEYLNRPAPRTFSLLTNRQQTTTYLIRILDALQHGTRIHMDLSKIDYTDMPTICVLSAFMVDPRTPGRFLQVTIPGPNRPQGKIWVETQFENSIIQEHKLNYGTGGFISRSANKIDNEIFEAILNSTESYFGTRHKAELRDLSAILNEIAENTVLHAAASGVGNLNWLINTRDIREGNKKIREYCLVDLGVGIYDSIMVNVIRTKGQKLKHRLVSILDEGMTQNSFLSRQIPKGIGSSTNEATRGKGVRHVYKIAQSKIYDQFDIITNKAHVNLKDVSRINDDASSSFFGTVYYWRINIDA